MTAIYVTFLILCVFINYTKSSEIDVNGIAIEMFPANGSLDDVEMLIQEEAQVVNTLMELDNQLTNALDHVSSASGAVEIDVVVGESDDSITGSGRRIDDEIVVIIPVGPRLSEEEKNEIKEEIENEVVDTLDEIIVNEVEAFPAEKPQERGGSLTGVVERLFEEEAEAENELEHMQDELEKALDELPSKGPLVEIGVTVTESDGKQEVVDDEIVVIIPSSTGSRPRLTEEEKEILEEGIVKEAADALGKIIMDDFVGDDPEKNTELGLPASPCLQEDSPGEKALDQRTSAPFTDETTGQNIWADIATKSEPKPALRGAAGVWTGVRRSRRVILNDSNFRWAEAVEYMDAFPYES
ncbi:Hypothetical protein PHPALM_1560 [Phytophthora palmivora]|uniref:Uncharacterized protein n=1 Tax=Phytophthora palmivora TaxID=4796 RepID=A0A2P4YS08_9STRA|nr:Hypothetical protein PHPALM_1560 [Phytophthora palmivora]